MTRFTHLAILALILLPFLTVAGQTNHVKGTVLDETGRAVDRAKIQISIAGQDKSVLHSDQAGSFETQLETGEYRVTITKKRYAAITARDLIIHPGDNSIRYTLQTYKQGTFSRGAEIAVPRFRKSSPKLENTEREEEIHSNLPDISQILVDRYGELRTPGAQPGVSKTLMDSGTAFKPAVLGVSGDLSNRNLENLEVKNENTATGLANRLVAYEAPAASLVPPLRSGANRWNAGIAGLFPAFQFQKGTARLGDWTPKITISSPVGRRFQFSNVMSGAHGLVMVQELPKDQNSIVSWQGADTLRAELALSPDNIMKWSLYGEYLTDANLGLSPFVPIASTVNLTSKQARLEMTDEQRFNKVIVESGVSLQHLHSALSPQGGTPYILFPGSADGSYFETLIGDTRKAKAFTSILVPGQEFLGNHSLQMGTDAIFSTFDHFAHRLPFQILNDNRQLEQATSFIGDSRFALSNTRAGTYLQDTWTLGSRIWIQYGVRGDWDKITSSTQWAPRGAVSFFPFANRRTKFFGYSGIYYPELNLSLIGQAEDQLRIDQFYNNGASAGSPQTEDFVVKPGRIRAPHYLSSKVGAEQRIFSGTFVSASIYWLAQRDVLAYRKIAVTKSLNQIQLLNSRRDFYRSVEGTIRQTFGRSSEVTVSYRRSRTFTNQLFDFDLGSGAFTNQYAGLLDYDSPNRVMSWGWTPVLPGEFSLSYLFEYRTGFPYTIYDQSYNVVGLPNQQRFPDCMRLNVGVEKIITIRDRKLGIRAGAVNITGHRNFTAVDNNVASNTFGQFAGTVGRSYNVRVRVIGH